MDEFIDGQPIPNQWLAAKAKALGVPKKELLVLAPDNDPHNCGTPGLLQAAEWFSGIYEQVGYRGSTFGVCITDAMTRGF